MEREREREVEREREREREREKERRRRRRRKGGSKSEGLRFNKNKNKNKNKNNNDKDLDGSSGFVLSCTTLCGSKVDSGLRDPGQVKRGSRVALVRHAVLCCCFFGSLCPVWFGGGKQKVKHRKASERGFDDGALFCVRAASHFFPCICRKGQFLLWTLLSFFFLLRFLSGL